MMKKQKNANKREIKRLCVFFLFFFSEKERRVFPAFAQTTVGFTTEITAHENNRYCYRVL